LKISTIAMFHPYLYADTPCAARFLSVCVLLVLLCDLGAMEISIRRALFTDSASGKYSRTSGASITAPSSNLKFFIGGMRSDDIIVNVVIPYFSVYFEVFGKQELAKKLLILYSTVIQKEDNSIVKNISEMLNMHEAWKKSLYSQGILELFRSYCSRDKCLECEIGKKVFN